MTITVRVSGTPTANHTTRVSGNPTADTTSRVGGVDDRLETFRAHTFAAHTFALSLMVGRPIKGNHTTRVTGL